MWVPKYWNYTISVFLLYKQNHLHVIVLVQLVYLHIYFLELQGVGRDVAKQLELVVSNFIYNYVYLISI